MIHVYPNLPHGDWVQMEVEDAWIEAIDPDEQEQERLVQEFGVPPRFLEAALDEAEAPRLEVHGDCRLMIVRAPSRQQEPGKPPFRSISLGLVLTPARIVTIACRQHEITERLLRLHAHRLREDRDPPLFILLLRAVADTFIDYLSDISEAIDDIEISARDSISNREVRHVLRYEKSMVYLNRALEADERVLREIESGHLLELELAQQSELADVRIEFDQAVYMARVNEDVLNETTGSFTSMISNNLNGVMKMLTALTIILTVPTLIGAMWGMNVPVPGEGSPTAFALLVGLAVAVAALTGFLFYRLGWLTIDMPRFGRDGDEGEA